MTMATSTPWFSSHRATLALPPTRAKLGTRNTAILKERAYIDATYAVPVGALSVEEYEDHKAILTVKATAKAQSYSREEIPDLILWKEVLAVPKHTAKRQRDDGNAANVVKEESYVSQEREEDEEKEKERYLIVPAPYGLAAFGVPANDRRTLGAATTLTFRGQLRAEQMLWADTVIRQMTDSPMPCCIIKLPCGYGKTALSIYLACKLGRRCAFTVDHESYLYKTQEEIRKWVPEARIGIVHGDKKEIDDTDFVLILIQTALARKYTSKDFQSCGIVFHDEAHHLGAPTFSKMTTLFTARYRIALSATPVPSNRPKEMLSWILGPIVIDVQRAPEKAVVHIMRYQGREMRAIDNPHLARAMMQERCMLDVRRNDLLVGKLIDLFMNPHPHPAQRRMLAVSKLLLHLEKIRVRLLDRMRHALAQKYGYEVADEHVLPDPAMRPKPSIKARADKIYNNHLEEAYELCGTVPPWQATTTTTKSKLKKQRKKKRKVEDCDADIGKDTEEFAEAGNAGGYSVDLSKVKSGTIYIDTAIANLWRLVVYEGDVNHSTQREPGDAPSVRPANVIMRVLFSVSKLIGSQDMEEQVNGFAADIVLGSHNLVRENLDLPWLDTLVLLLPCGSFEQTFGRVLRTFAGKNEPQLWCVADNDTTPWPVVGFARKFEYAVKEFGVDGKVISNSTPVAPNVTDFCLPQKDALVKEFRAANETRKKQATEKSGDSGCASTLPIGEWKSRFHHLHQHQQQSASVTL